ncbi:hypothetical protein CDL12_30023 [Handroanthus impetiginosus]|uniref:Uncharacterized protein n=1 Tax=Handroanthus impetiginosus TaxID=429701 RepID=A0A2G9FWR4_9LAMI|nr:hypothetical protein CDL12_30023 [Handroanthus impetiginosus]
MIKRRFYRLEHGSRDAPSESSSSSDSEVEAEATDETEVEEEEEEIEEEDDDEEENVVAEAREKADVSSSSGYESEDSSANEVNLDSSGLPMSDDDLAAQNGGQDIIGSLSNAEGNNVLTGTQHSGLDFDTTDCVLKCKSVFKCRLCPRIVCLSEETIKAHLNSKRHARSEKLRKEGRLKLMLNDDGQLEGETSLENHASTTISGQMSAKPKKKGKGRWKHKKRSIQETSLGKTRQPTEKREKRQKNDS